MRQFSRMVPRCSQLPQRFCWFTTITRGIGTPAFGCHASTRSRSRATALRRNHATKAARPTAVHPRACGERVTRDYGVAEGDGSSPRLRGTVELYAEVGNDDRFIPAPAGNGLPQPPNLDPLPVHPRACGERFNAEQADGLPERFIPAPAGNGEIAVAFWPLRTVHPRACGERYC